VLKTVLLGLSGVYLTGVMGFGGVYILGNGLDFVQAVVYGSKWPAYLLPLFGSI
jgi:hypothetical protein